VTRKGRFPFQHLGKVRLAYEGRMKLRQLQRHQAQAAAAKRAAAGGQS
jgi:hypothetical protein